MGGGNFGVFETLIPSEKHFESFAFSVRTVAVDRFEGSETVSRNKNHCTSRAFFNVLGESAD